MNRAKKINTSESLEILKYIDSIEWPEHVTNADGIFLEDMFHKANNRDDGFFLVTDRQLLRLRKVRDRLKRSGLLM
jgi:hypothetical protein